MPIRAIKHHDYKGGIIMIDACHRIILELQEPQFLPSLTAKKEDTGRTLEFLLMDHGKPYIISQECSAMFTALKPDGNIIYNPCRIEDNIIFYTFTPQTCAVAGQLQCELKLYGADDKLLTAPRFTLIVEDTVFETGSAVESASEVSALTALISDTTELIEDLEQKLADNAFADAHSAVCFTPQTLTQAQQAQARNNLTAAAGFRRILTSADDFDAITEDGVYVYSTASVPANAPFANAAVVAVFGSQNATAQRIQVGFRYGIAGQGKFRALYNSAWFNWSQFATFDDAGYTLLWENASKTSSFAAQTISVDTKEYDMLLIVCGYNTSMATGQGTVSVWLRNKGEGDTTACLTVDYITSGGSVTRPFRSIVVKSSRAQITFGNGCKYDGTASDSNVIPYYIYGIRGVRNS